MTEPLLTYALHENILKHIDEVPNGIACKCICPECKTSLIAKNNPANSTTSHFAHCTINNCSGSQESALHIIAKEAIKSLKKLKLPNFYTYLPDGNVMRDPNQIVEFEKIEIEKEISINGLCIIADAVGYIQDKMIIIEFAKTHFVDFEKKNKLMRMGIPCIEVKLNPWADTEKGFIESMLLKDSANIYWINNSKFEKKRKEHLEKYYANKKDNDLMQIERQKIQTNKNAIKNLEVENKFKEKYDAYLHDKDVTLFQIDASINYNCPNKRENGYCRFCFNNINLLYFDDKEISVCNFHSIGPMISYNPDIS